MAKSDDYRHPEGTRWTTYRLAYELGPIILRSFLAHRCPMRSLGGGPVCYRRGRRLVYPRSGLVAFLARELQATAKGEGAPPAEGK